MEISQRNVVIAAAEGVAVSALPGTGFAQGDGHKDVESGDRILICNEDSNTLTLIDPNTNTVVGTIMPELNSECEATQNRECLLFAQGAFERRVAV